MRGLGRLSLTVWLILLVTASLLPRVPPAAAVVRFPGAAYAAHALAYAVLCALAAWALKLRRRRALVLTVLAASALGFALECIQPLTGRTFDLWDVAANAAGASLGLAATLLERRLLPRRSAAPPTPSP